jgi:hypothetical protein
MSIKKIHILFLLVFLFLFSPVFSFAENIEDLRKDINELKNRVEVLSAEKEDMEDRLSKLIRVTGYADIDFTMTDKKGENSQFRTHKFALILKKDWGKEWSFFSEVEYEYGPELEASNKTMTKGEGKIFNEIFYVEYKPTYLAELRFGRFLTPAGIWNQEPYAPFVPTDDRPLHIRQIFPQVSDGLQLQGQTNLASVVTRYHLYAANGAGEPGKTDSNQGKSVGGRVVFKLPILDDFQIGGSSFGGEDIASTNLKRESSGADLKLQIRDLKFWGEYANAKFSPATGSGSSYDRSGYYGQVMYDISKFSLIYRYDYYDPSSVTANDKTTINTVAVNYRFNPDIVTKLEHHFYDLENPSSTDYTKTIFSVCVYFGE